MQTRELCILATPSYLVDSPASVWFVLLGFVSQLYVTVQISTSVESHAQLGVGRRIFHPLSSLDDILLDLEY